MNELINTDFHDSLVYFLGFNFEEKTLTLIVEFFNDEKDDYDRVKYDFLSAEDIVLAKVYLFDIRHIYYLDIEKIDRDSDDYHTKAVFLTDFGGPSGELEFDFKDARITDVTP